MSGVKFGETVEINVNQEIENYLANESGNPVFNTMELLRLSRIQDVDQASSFYVITKDKKKNCAVAIAEVVRYGKQICFEKTYRLFRSELNEETGEIETYSTRCSNIPLYDFKTLMKKGLTGLENARDYVANYGKSNVEENKVAGQKQTSKMSNDANLELVM